MNTKEIYKWMKKYKLLTIMIAIIFCICIIIVVQIPYWIGNIFPLITTQIMPSDLLLFAGSFLAFIGTISLGFFALYQNQKMDEKAKEENSELRKLNALSNDINNRLLKLQEVQHMPLLDVLSEKVEMVQYQNEKKISIKIKNIGQCTLKYCTYEVMTKEEIEKIESPTTTTNNLFNGFLRALGNLALYFGTKKNKEFIGVNGKDIVARIEIGESKEIEINIPNGMNKAGLKIDIFNIFGMKYKEIIKFDIEAIEENYGEVEIKNVIYSADISY